jgi:hypothetical protein
MSAAMALGAILVAASAAAQPVGTFRWQLQPLCNIVTLAVTRNGSIFEVEGTDDQCGAGNAASASGTAFVNPDGSIGLGITIVTTPSGTPVHVGATLNLATLNGEWRDSTGASGPFVFTPGAGSGGGARPASTLGLSGVSLGFGLASGGTPGNVSLQVNLDQVKGGLQLRTPSASSVGMGAEALRDSGPGTLEAAAFGSNALRSLTTGVANTAVGAFASHATTTGVFNTAIGASALSQNVMGQGNVAVGALAAAGATGSSNVAVGASTLQVAGQAERNVAVGAQAMFRGGGSENVAIGFAALDENPTGVRNVVVGALAGGSGSDNVAVGHAALASSSTGLRNVAVGSFAGGGLSDNIMIGYSAGQALPSDSSARNNIYIGSTGFAPDNNTIRIGNPSHAGAVIAGIASQTSAGGVPVLINAGGRMGTTTSSVRFKTDVVPLGADARRLHDLRPVRFVYKPEYDDGSRQAQFGLIAEEVATSFPELIVRDEVGRPWTVRYHLLTPLLLAEVQRLEQQRATQAEELNILREEVRALRGRLERLDVKQR